MTKIKVEDLKKTHSRIKHDCEQAAKGLNITTLTESLNDQKLGSEENSWMIKHYDWWPEKEIQGSKVVTRKKWMVKIV